MKNHRKPGRLNLKALGLLVTMVVVLGAGTFTARYIHKRLLAQRALEAGLAAFEREDWPSACEHFRQYLKRRPTDETENRHIEIPDKYAHALLRVRPLEPDNIGAALGAYRRVLRLDPTRASTYEALAGLYIDLQDYEELAYVARRRQEVAPDDPQAVLWLATAHIGQRKLDEARDSLEALTTQLDMTPLPLREGLGEGSGARHDGKTPDYVIACVMLSRIAAQGRSDAERAAALDWLDRAVAYDPQSATALLQRARLHRLWASAVGAGHDAQLAAARQDLEAASALQSTDPRERLLLCREWAGLRDYAHALTELEALAALDEAQLKDTFVSLDEWRITEFLLKADLLLRLESAGAAAALADTLLAELQPPPYRTRVLPLAVRVHALAGKTDAARRCLDEYRAAVSISAARDESNATLALLEAFVARAANQPYRVINLLEPFLDQEAGDPSIPKLLADAYWQTDQKRRAGKILEQSTTRRGPPREPQVLLQLARERLAAGDWTNARRLVKPLGAEHVAATLVRLEARLRETPQQPPEIVARTLETLATELDALGAAHPRNVDARVLRASVAAALNQTELAETLLQKAIRECADPAPAELMLVRLYVQNDNLDAALEVCRAAGARPGAGATPWLARAEVHELRQQYNQAREAMQAGIAAVQDTAGQREIRIRLAQFNLLHDARDTGITQLEELAAEDPTDVHARSLLLTLPEVLADAPFATELIDELRATEGARGLRWRLHQAALWLAGEQWQSKPDEIQELLTYCLDADAGWSSPALLLGQLHTRLHDFDDAEQVYRRTLAANPLAADVTERLLALLQRQQRFDDALLILDTLQGNIPVRPDQRVRILLGAGEVDRAIQQLEFKVAGDDQDVDARVALAQYVYRRSRNAAAALKYLDEAETVAGPSVAITFVRVSILRAEDRLDEARQLLDDQITREQSFDAYFLRAAFLAGSDETDAAEQDFRRLSTLEHRPDGFLLLGMFYAERDRLDEALDAWQQGLKSFPSDAVLRRRLMMGLLARAQADDQEHGLRLLSQLEQEFPDDAELLWIRAVLQLNADTPAALAQAESLLLHVVELQPTAVRAHLKRIELALQRGDAAAASERIDRALGSNPDDPSILLARARLERRLGNPDTARTFARLALDKDPRDATALDLLVQLALQDGTPGLLEEARGLLERALAPGHQDPQLTHDLLLVLAARGEADRVNIILARLREDAPTHTIVPTLLALTEQHWRRGETALVEQRLAEAETRAANDPDVLRLRVQWLGHNGDFDQIVTLMTGDGSQPPRTPELLYVAGSLLTPSATPAHHQTARSWLETARAQLTPGSALWLDIVATIYRAGAADRAIALYRELLAENPDNTRALNDLAWILAEHQDDYEEALRLASRGLELAPTDVHLLDTRGVILANLPDRLDDARRDFERCVELKPPGSPARAQALLQLARVTARLDDRVVTRRRLREALEIDRRHHVFSPQERQEIVELQDTELGAR